MRFDVALRRSQTLPHIHLISGYARIFPDEPALGRRASNHPDSRALRRDSVAGPTRSEMTSGVPLIREYSRGLGDWVMCNGWAPVAETAVHRRIASSKAGTWRCAHSTSCHAQYAVVTHDAPAQLEQKGSVVGSRDLCVTHAVSCANALRQLSGRRRVRRRGGCLRTESPATESDQDEVRLQ
jgi:hypothetical protein